MSKDKLVFDHEGVAQFFNVSRMTIYRWEKLVELPRDYMGCRLKTLTPDELMKWKRKVKNKLFRQRYRPQA